MNMKIKITNQVKYTPLFRKDEGVLPTGLFLDADQDVVFHYCGVFVVYTDDGICDCPNWPLRIAPAGTKIELTAE